MWSTPSSTARRSTARAASGSLGGPNTPGPASCIAPKPMRLMGLSPRNDVLVMTHILRLHGRADKKSDDPVTATTRLTRQPAVYDRDPAMSNRLPEPRLTKVYRLGANLAQPLD